MAVVLYRDVDPSEVPPSFDPEMWKYYHPEDSEEKRVFRTARGRGFPLVDQTISQKEVFMRFIRYHGTYLFEQYTLTIRREIARGAFGVVYSVLVDGVPQALKLERRSDFISASKFYTKVRNEYAIQKFMNRRNSKLTPQPISHHLFEWSNNTFSAMFMEKIPDINITVSQILERKDLDMHIVAGILSQTMELLSILCSLDVVHGDLHWGNLFVITDQLTDIQQLSPGTTHLQVIDFGMAARQRCMPMLETYGLIQDSYRATYDPRAGKLIRMVLYHYLKRDSDRSEGIRAVNQTYLRLRSMVRSQYVP